MLLGHKKDWATAKKVMGDANKFLESLKNFDVSNAKESDLNKIRKTYFTKSDFTITNLMATPSSVDTNPQGKPSTLSPFQQKTAGIPS